MSDDQKRVGPDLDPSASQNRLRLTLGHDNGGEFGSPAGYEGIAADADGMDPFYFLRVLHRRRWIAITVFLLVVGISVMYASTIVPIYEARVRVLVEPERLILLRIEDIVEQDRSVESQIAVLQSRWLAKKTMESMGLLQQGPALARPNSPPEPRSGVRAVLSKLVTAVRQLRSPTEPPALTQAEGEAFSENAQIDAFQSGLTATSTTKGLLDIKYRSPDPVLAARIANGFARQYMEQNIEVRFAAVKEVTDWLAARLGEQLRKVEASERALQQFREQNQMVVVPGSDNPTMVKLNELMGAITRTNAARLEKEALVNKIEALRADRETLQRLPQMVATPLVQQYRLELDKLQRDRAQMAEKLQDRHPDMIRVRETIQVTQRRLELEMDRIIESVREDAAATRAAETRAAETFEQQKREALAQNRKSVELAILDREAQSNRQIYDMLMQRTRETNIAKEIKPSQVRILDAAEAPRVPISPDTRQHVLIGALAGLVLGIAMAFGLEQIDNRIKTPDEIKSRLGLPLLGFVPEVHPRNGSHGPPVLTNGVPSAFIEAVRSVRTNVLYSIADESLKTIVITSASLSEGKTVVAGNLAIAIAQAGQRILLIDADMRRPTLHELFKLKRDPGLSNLLVGTEKASEVVQRSGVPNLWVMPSGHRSPNPPELLGSLRFKNMMAALADHFDWVLLDAPPILPVTDACVLANNTTGVVFVVGAERVSRHVARRALEQLGNVDARVVGGILTRMEIDRHRYYYSKYYHPRYGEYASLGSDGA